MDEKVKKSGASPSSDSSSTYSLEEGEGVPRLFVCGWRRLVRLGCWWEAKGNLRLFAGGGDG